jgi:hypothetical protein
MGSLSFALETTLRGFDERFPQGADYAVIPNVVNVDDPALLDWIKAQAAKGATIVGVCIGATVVANTGLMDGRRATSHFGTEASRSQRFPKVKWERNIRYVADGNVISSAGISASMPISIALVEAIAGRAKATSTARDVGMSDWSSFHNSDVFRAAQPARGKPVEGPRAKKATVGVPVKSGDDEIALGLTADAYFLTSKVEPLAMAVSSGKVRLANGLELIPNGILGKDPVDRMLQPLSAVDATRTLDLVLADISKTYGVGAAQLAALIMEYPGFRPGPAGS